MYTVGCLVHLLVHSVVVLDSAILLSFLFILFIYFFMGFTMYTPHLGHCRQYTTSISGLTADLACMCTVQAAFKTLVLRNSSNPQNYFLACNLELWLM